MKLCVAIVHNRDKSRIMDEMTRAGFKFTVIGSTGGFLREGNTTFLIGLDDQEVPLLQKVFSETCPAREQLVNVAPIEAGPKGHSFRARLRFPLAEGCCLFWEWMSSSVFDLDAVPGLNLAKQTARKVLEPGSGVHAVLLSGAHGGGAEDLAKFIAMGWACKKPDATGLPCGECQACKSTENDKCVDVQWIRPAGPSNLIRMEAIVERKGDGETIPITSFFRTQPLMARHKVAILAGADRMTSDATNAMLKTLEEPPSFAKLILTTDAIGKILPTILSRCLVVMCELPPSDLYQSLPDHERIFSEGNPGRLAQIQLAGTEYASLLSIFETAERNGIAGALGASEKARQVSEGLQDRLKMGARHAHCEVLKCLALWVVQNRQNHPESGRIIAESHRRILGNVNATLEYDALFATIFG